MHRTSAPRSARMAMFASSRSAAVLAGLIVIMLALGGGSAQAPVEQLIAELIGLGLLIAPALHARWLTLFAQDRLFGVLAVALIVLILLQLVPLPGPVWRDWSGRGLFAAGDRLLAGRELARPLSLDPDQTMACAVFLIPALAIGLRVRLLADFTQGWILAYLAFLACSLALALIQVTSGPGEWHLYANAHANLPTGLFANRNHQAIAMACGIPLAAGLNRIWQDSAAGHTDRRGGWLFAAAVAGGVVGALITGSRTGCALLAPALLAGVAIQFGGRGNGRQARMIVLATAGGLVAVVLAGIVLAKVQPGGALGLVLSRSYTGDDDRYMFWPVVLRMIPKYWPWGTGLGSFRRAFEIDEPDSLLAPLYLNHAHNDWFEFTLEAGLAGVALAAGFVIWLLWRWLPAWRSGSADPLRQAAGTVIALLLAHSCFDYPIRTVALSCCFAACVALLSRPAPRRLRPVRSTPR